VISHSSLSSHYYKTNKYLIVPQQTCFSPTITVPNNFLPPAIRKSTRSTKSPAYLKNFYYNIAVGIESKNFYLVQFPIFSFVNYSKFSNNHKHFAFSISFIVEFKTYAQVVKHENWRKAMDDEINALVQTGIWELADLPIGKQTVGCKWVYKIKHKVDGSIERFKTRRLVIKGFTQ